MTANIYTLDDLPDSGGIGPRRRADRARIAQLEQWHAAQDCREAGHTMPHSYTHPAPGDLDGVRETIDVSAIMSPGEAITTLVGLPDHVTQVPCAHCGARLLARIDEGHTVR